MKPLTLNRRGNINPQHVGGSLRASHILTLEAKQCSDCEYKTPRFGPRDGHCLELSDADMRARRNRGLAGKCALFLASTLTAAEARRLSRLEFRKALEPSEKVRSGDTRS